MTSTASLIQGDSCTDTKLKGVHVATQQNELHQLPLLLRIAHSFKINFRHQICRQDPEVRQDRHARTKVLIVCFCTTPSYRWETRVNYIPGANV